VMTFNPRGMWHSDGTSTHAGTLQDIGAACQWLNQEDVQERFSIDPDRITLGGYSHGGAMALVYTAGDPGIQRVISISGNDYGSLSACLNANRS
jgi:dienelactone hydrolase